MKKINLFNRNTDSPSYRRKPVFRGIVENRHTAKARCPGIAIAMTCPAGDFSSQGDEKHNVRDAVTAPAIRRAGWVPAFAGMTKKIYGMTAVIFALFIATPSFAETTAQDLLDKKTVVSKYYVDQELETKQDTISIDKVLLYGADGKAILEDIYVPAIVVTNDAGTQLNGNTIGVLDYSSYNTLEGDFGIFKNFTNSSYDNFIPTVRAVANEFNDVWNELGKKQYIIPGGSAGNVVTYTGDEGKVGSATVSSAATYNGTTLINGDDIANIAAVETAVGTKQDKMTCAGYEPGHEGDEDYCWLYNVNNSAVNNSVAVGGQNCVGYNGKVPDSGGQSQCCSGVVMVHTCIKGDGCYCGCANDSDCPGSNVCDTSTRVCTTNSKI